MRCPYFIHRSEEKRLAVWRIWELSMQVALLLAAVTSTRPCIRPQSQRTYNGSGWKNLPTFWQGLIPQFGSVQCTTGSKTLPERGNDTDHPWGKDRRCKCALCFLNWDQHNGRKSGGRRGRSEQQPAAAHFHLKGQTRKPTAWAQSATDRVQIGLLCFIREEFDQMISQTCH